MKRSNLAPLALLVLFGLFFPQLAKAHIGPPFPILEDQPIPGYTVTVTTNPDVWQAVAYVTLTATSPSPVAVSGVDIWIQPVNRRLPKAVCHTSLERARNPIQFYAEPNFDQPENFYFGVDLRLADGTVEHLLTTVEATPPGLGPWGLLFFVFPFALFGGLWGLVFFRRRRRRAAMRAARGAASPSDSVHPPQKQP